MGLSLDPITQAMHSRAWNASAAHLPRPPTCWTRSCLSHTSRPSYYTPHASNGRDEPLRIIMPSPHSSPWQDVASLEEGKDGQEKHSSNVQGQVADLVDVDRTGELLLWLFSSMFSKKTSSVQESEESSNKSDND